MGGGGRSWPLRRLVLMAAPIVFGSTLPGCTADPFATAPSTSTTQRALLPGEIALGLKLLPGDEGTLPVRARWVVIRDYPAAIAVDGDRLYVSSISLTAFNLKDGSVAWEYSDENTEQADTGDGETVIGLDGPDVVRVIVPYYYDLRVDRRTGQRLSIGMPQPDGPSSGFIPFPAPEPSRFQVTMDLDEIIGRWPDGRVAWRLAVDNPFVGVLDPVQAGDAIVVVTSSQHIVVLEPVPT